MESDVIVATSNIDMVDDKFSVSSLHGMAKQAPGLKVKDGFGPDSKPIGIITTARVTRGGLSVGFAIDECEKVYLVPCYKVKEFKINNGIREINEVDLVEFQATDIPCDTHLTPIKEV